MYDAQCTAYAVYYHVKCSMLNVHDDVVGDLLNSILIDIPAAVKHVVNSETGAWGCVKQTERSERKEKKTKTCRKSDTNCLGFIDLKILNKQTCHYHTHLSVLSRVLLIFLIGNGVLTKTDKHYLHRIIFSRIARVDQDFVYTTQTKGNR